MKPRVLLLVALAACGRADSRPDARRAPQVDPQARPPPSPEESYRLAFGEDPPPQGPLVGEAQTNAGFHVFRHTCVTCHQPSGLGMPGAFPPLAGSDFLMADKGRAIDVVLWGLSGAVTVNGRPFQASMPSHAFLTDDDVANVLTFVRNHWGNAGDPVARDEVAARRARLAPR